VSDSITIDSFGPLPVERPTTAADLCALVKETRAAKEGLYPVGGRTTLDLGRVPTKPGRAVAVNASGPRRYGYGTLRDYVIGSSFATDDGVEVKAGGRVVKNVAGYDLMKLQIGALGTLGVVTQLTLKVKPKPEARAAVVFGCDSAALGGVLDRLAASKTRPVAVELLSSGAWRETSVNVSVSAEWVLLVGFEEKAAAVRWQVSALCDELKAAPVRDVAELTDTTPFDTITALQLRPESRFIGKRSVTPSRLAAELQAPRPGLTHAHALTGVIWTHGDESLPEGAIVRRCPTERKKTLPVWGAPSASWDLMRHVKKTLDPDNVFNPGRLFGDI
jgi:glycolate oxidase FAD binding subunit